MFINPDDRRLGNRRQQLTRQRIAAQLDDEKRRRRGMSQFSQIGAQERLARGRRAPLRGSAAGMRSMFDRRDGGFATLLQGRGFGRRPNEKDLIDTPAFDIPRVTPPTPPGTFPGDPARQTLASTPLLDMLRDQGTQPVASGQALDDLFGPSRSTPALDPSIRGDMGPQSPVSLDALTGLVPLGGGNWFDPATGMIHGPGGASAKVM